MHKKPVFLNLILRLGAVLMAYANAGLAAEGNADNKATNQLAADEIVVTARKQKETLQEVPLSVTAFSAEKLEQVGAFDNEDVALLTPNFNTERQVGRRLDRPTVRGMASPPTGAEPNASYFIDGVFVSGSIQSQTLGPIERVEVLRGPQSAKFGRATFSGAVNYVTKRPTDVAEAQLKTTVASHDSATVSGWSSGPLLENELYYFVSGSWDTYGGEYRNSLKFGQAPIHLAAPLTAPARGDESRLGGTDTADIAAKFIWTPTERSEFTFKASYNEADDDHYVQLIQELGELNCFLPTWGPDNSDPGRPAGAPNEIGTIDNSGEVWFTTSPGAFCGTLDPEKVSYYSLNPKNPYNPAFNPATSYPTGFVFPIVPGMGFGIGYTLPLEGSPREARYNLPDFIDGIQGSPGCLGSNGVPGECEAAPADPGTRRKVKRFLVGYEQLLGAWTLNAFLAHNREEFDQVFDLDRSEQRPALGLGLFHQADRGNVKDYNFELRLQSPSDNALRGSLGLNYYYQTGDYFQRRFVGTADALWPTNPLVNKTKNLSFFGDVEYNFTDEWSASAEARWSTEDRDVDSGQTCSDVMSPFDGQRNKNEISTKSLTPRFIVRYQPTDERMYYASVAQGEKPAQFTSAWYRTTTDPCSTLEDRAAGAPVVLFPEKQWTYELGARSEWLGRRLVANLTVFYIDWKNQAVRQNTLVGGFLTQINVNAGRSEVWGAELETNFVFTENLSGQFSYGLADAKFVEYNDELLAQLTGVGLSIMPNGRPERSTDNFLSLVYDESANNAKGKRVPGSPKHSFVFGLNYSNEVELNLWEGPKALDWFARTDFVLETDRYLEVNNFTKFPNRKRWNARIGLEAENWTLTAFVNNVLDDLSPTGVFSFPTITGARFNNSYIRNPGMPDDGMPNGFVDADAGISQNSVSPAYGRSFGLEYTYRFGG